MATSRLHHNVQLAPNLRVAICKMHFLASKSVLWWALHHSWASPCVFLIVYSSCESEGINWPLSEHSIPPSSLFHSLHCFHVRSLEMLENSWQLEVSNWTPILVSILFIGKVPTDQEVLVCFSLSSYFKAWEGMNCPSFRLITAIIYPSR